MNQILSIYLRQQKTEIKEILKINLKVLYFTSHDDLLHMLVKLLIVEDGFNNLMLNSQVDYVQAFEFPLFGSTQQFVQKLEDFMAEKLQNLLQPEKRGYGEF